MIEEDLRIRSTSLTSLEFFKKLHTVKGVTPGFSLHVYENANLQALFPQNVTIKRGPMFFHSNPKFPIKTIEDFKENVIDLRGKESLTAEDFAPNLVRKEAFCRIEPLIANVTKIGLNVAILDLKPHDGHPIFGYILYYRPASFKNVSIFDSHGV